MSEKTDAWMPLWIGAYLADTQHLTRDEHGGYLLLLMAYWRSGGPLADDDKRLATIVKATPKEWRELRATLAEFFTVSDGFWSHKRVEAELAQSLERKSKAGSKAKAAAQARWGKTASTASSNAPSIPQALLNECPTPSPITPSLRSGVERASRLPKPFELPDEWRQWAETQRQDLDIKATAEKFADFWHGKPGKAGTKLDWLATWRNWVREERSPKPGQQGFSQPIETPWQRSQRERVAEMTGGLVSARKPSTTAPYTTLEFTHEPIAITVG